MNKAHRVCLRNECRGCTPALRAGDATAARAWAEAAVAVDAGRLRTQVAGLPAEVGLVQIDTAALVDRVAAALASGALRACGGAAKARLLPLARRLPATAASAPAPAASSARATPAPAPSPAPADSTFGANLDVAAMVAVLQQAAQDGTPFCEECARAAAAREAA